MEKHVPFSIYYNRLSRRVSIYYANIDTERYHSHVESGFVEGDPLLSRREGQLAVLTRVGVVQTRFTSRNGQSAGELSGRNRAAHVVPV